eukprot:16973-Heterococcus_DN1.PRE.3
MAAAAKCNKPAEVQYLHSQGCAWPNLLLEGVVRRGHLDLAHWCHEHGCDLDTTRAPAWAAESGNVELMAWVLQQPGIRLDEAVMRTAASKGHTAIGFPYRTSELCTSAAKGGSVEVLAYLQQQDMLTTTATSSRLLDVAACFDRLSAVKWFRAQGAQWPPIYGLGPWSGDVLAWARAEGYTTTAAIAVQLSTAISCSHIAHPLFLVIERLRLSAYMSKVTVYSGLHSSDSSASSHSSSSSTAPAASCMDIAWCCTANAAAAAAAAAV